MREKDIGQIGEKIALEHYKKQGFSLVEQNYYKPFGEIDIIVQKEDQLVLIEVKTVSRETLHSNRVDFFNPGENIHTEKQKRLRKTIAAFLRESKGMYKSWRFDVALIEITTDMARCRIKVLEDVIL